MTNYRVVFYDEYRNEVGAIRVEANGDSIACEVAQNFAALFPQAVRAEFDGGEIKRMTVAL